MAIISSSFQLSAIGGFHLDKSNMPLVQKKLSDAPKKRVAWYQAMQGHPDDSRQLTRQGSTAGYPSDPDSEPKSYTDTTRNSNLSKIADLCHALKKTHTDLQHERCIG